MHPVSDRDRNPYERAFKGITNVKILSGSELPSTFELLVDSDYHASIASAAHYDALGLGVPTIIMPFAGHELLMPLVDLGHARLASTPQEMLNIVMAKEIPSLSNETRAYYYLPDSVQEIRKCLGINAPVKKIWRPYPLITVEGLRWIQYLPIR
jgi:hypothetical protein